MREKLNSGEGRQECLPHCGADIPVCSSEPEMNVEQTFLSARFPHPFRPVDLDLIHTSHRRLPHWEQENRIYFVTFRLADSIAHKKLEQWREEASRLKLESERSRLYFRRQQAWLDQGAGSCILRNPDCAKAVEGALLHFDTERYFLGDYVIMPNHIHLIVLPTEGNTLSQIIKSWKGFSARRINEALGRTGSVWMDESFDHIIRNAAHLKKFRDYIRQNPAKAGLNPSAFQLGCGALFRNRQIGMSASQENEGRQECLPHCGADIPVCSSEPEMNVEQTFLSARSESVQTVEQTFLSAHVESGASVEQTLLSAHRRIHMLGIGGIGMAGLAFLLKERGHAVSGSDAQENRQTQWLRGKGITIQEAVPPDAEWIIRSRAVPDSHPDVRSATVPVSWRGEVLPELLKDRFTIAVSGTHGKTTTTAMIAQILDCGFCIGGEVKGFDGVARDGDIMAVEADESDGTVANYHPDIAVITNIEYDHMEHHAGVEEFENCFRRFIANTKEKIIYCAEDPAASRLCRGNPKAVGVPGVECRVSLPGRHNRLNAGLALAVCRHLKCPDAVSFQRLETLKPVKRRFETVYEGDYTIISDYAHHPTEIRALIGTALETLRPKRLLGVFQPHRYTRTKALGPDFPPAFQGLEKLWLLPVYAASEEPLEGGTTDDLIKRFSNDWKNRINFFQSLEETWQDIQVELKCGDVLLIIGAGDVEQMGEWSKGVVE